jgi:NADPH-dependent 2,4-dienoyl-CoA reductase/sulfur reductase-like enzyme
MRRPAASNESLAVPGSFSQPHIVILGAGHSGGRAAEALRGAGYAGKVTLLGSERHPPYERPPLSKDLLAGAIEPERAYLKPLAWYEAAGIALRLGATAVEIDRSAHRLRLADGSTLPYDRLLLTTGARPRRLALPGLDSTLVHYLRDIEDSLALRARLAPGKRLIVVGAGFIGLEGAAIARRLGAEATVLELADRPLARVAAPEIGAFFADLHRREGVDLRTGASLAAVEESGGRLHVTTSAGERLAGDALLIGIGAVPNAELAAAAGLPVDDGIVVDQWGRTSDPDIFAAGDATRHFNPLLGRSLRLEAWQNAQNQAIAVAKVMAGGEEPYSELPWFWSDQYAVNFQTAGAPERWTALAWRGRPEEGRFTVFYLDGAVPVGGATVNNARDMRFVKLLVAAGRPVDAGALADPARKLADLCRG